MVKRIRGGIHETRDSTSYNEEVSTLNLQTAYFECRIFVKPRKGI